VTYPVGMAALVAASLLVLWLATCKPRPVGAVAGLSVALVVATAVASLWWSPPVF
jgi:hypothetical protein